MIDWDGREMAESQNFHSWMGAPSLRHHESNNFKEKLHFLFYRKRSKHMTSANVALIIRTLETFGISVQMN